MDSEMWNYFLEWITVMLVYYTFSWDVPILNINPKHNLCFFFAFRVSKLLSKVRNTLNQSCFVQKPVLKK